MNKTNNEKIKVPSNPTKTEVKDFPRPLKTPEKPSTIKPSK